MAEVNDVSDSGSCYFPDVSIVENWLRERDQSRLAPLWALADRVRREHVGDEVHLRGLIEISNHCSRRCHYCGINARNRGLVRYRMNIDEVLAAARKAYQYGYGTIVLQSGEDNVLTTEWVANLIKHIKDTFGLAVTLSLGERSRADLIAWRRAGADRYLLRFETSDSDLFGRIHPARPGVNRSRLFMLEELRQSGYEVGSGVMVGLPGQSYESLLADLLLFRELDLDMIGIGPFIPHPATVLGKMDHRELLVPADELTACKMVALARLACPEANIPSTTALSTLNMVEGRTLGLRRGANVIMPNLTPDQYRKLYDIYPQKACIRETAGECNRCLKQEFAAIGRCIGTGPGNRIRQIARK